MRNCFVPLCDKQCRNNPKRRMFLVPKSKEVFDLWLSILPKIRVIKSHDKVCERHFRKEDIITTYDHVIQGQMFQMERGRARLKKNALPFLNLPTSDEIDAYMKSKTIKYSDIEAEENELPETSECDTPNNINIDEADELDDDFSELISVTPLDPTQSVHLSTEIEAESDDIQANFQLIVEENCSSKVMEVFNMLYDEIYEVVLPSTLWGVHRCPERTMIFFSYVDPKEMRTTKMVSISDSGSVNVFFANKLINELNLADEIISTDVLSNILSQANDMFVCSKASQSELCEVETKSATMLCKSCESICHLDNDNNIKIV